MDKKMLDLYLRSLIEKNATGNNETAAADGGCLVGVEIANQIYNRMISTSSILSSALKITLNKGLTVKVPYLNDYLSVDERETAIRAYWIDEAGTKTACKPQLGSVNLELGKLVVRVPYTDELFNDRNDLVDWLVTCAGDAIRNKIEQGMLFNETESVLGIAGGGDGEIATIYTDFATTPTEAQLQAAYKLLNPLAIPGARWYVTRDCYANLSGCDYDVITREGNSMYIIGLPVEVCPWLVDSVHIMVGNFAAYGLVTRDAEKLVSDHIRFLYDESELRVVVRVAGSPITENKTINGVSNGWFVVQSDELTYSSTSSSKSSEG